MKQNQNALTVPSQVRGSDVPKHHGHKVWLLIIPAIAIVLFCVFFVLSNGTSHAPKISQLSPGVYGIKSHACDLLTQDKALSLMGAGGLSTSRDKDLTVQTQRSKVIKTSNCHYDTYLPAKGAPSYTVVLAVQTPLTLTGAKNIQNTFLNDRPKGSKNVKNYGDAAFWNTPAGQLHILKHNTWYTLTYGPPRASERTLDQTKKLADLLLPKL